MTQKTREYIVQLIARYVQGNLNKREMEDLDAWRMESSKNEEIFQRMISRRHFEESLTAHEMTGEEMDAEWKQIYTRTIGSRRIGLRRVLQYAAIAVMLLSVGGVLYFSSEKYLPEKEVVVAKKNTIQELESRAILVLSDGREFDLKNEEDLEALANHRVALSADSEMLTYLSGNVDTIVEYHMLRIPRGGEYVLVLSDGSTVYLNAESELAYPAHFTGQERRVRLKGEAYFEVQKDATKPFIVDVDPLRVQVMGTEFGVRAYSDEECIKTTLKQGKVSVESEERSVILTPDLQATFNRSDGRLDAKEVNVNLYIGWKDGRLIFDNCPLERVLKDLGRWYAFNVVFEREESRVLPFSLNIKKHEVFAEVLDLLEETGCVKFEIEDNTVIVK